LTKPSANHPAGFLTFTLHAHLPYVVNHGTWPHGMEWLHEAAAETYLPFLRMLKNLERDKIRFNCNINLSPSCSSSSLTPSSSPSSPNYLNRKVVAAREDEAFFIQSGETHLAETARFWHRFFSQALEDFYHFDRNIIAAFRHFNDTGLIDIITCGATHGYMPLLGTDESVRAQIRTPSTLTSGTLASHPRGIWGARVRLTAPPASGTTPSSLPTAPPSPQASTASASNKPSPSPASSSSSSTLTSSKSPSASPRHTSF